MINKIQKRDGRVVDYDDKKISNAIFMAMSNVCGGDFRKSEELAQKVGAILESVYIEAVPTVENIQDIVEKVLMENGFFDVAKHYIKYRAERTRVREKKSEHIRTMDELTNSDAKSSDMKRDNANIDGDTPMGVMLKYGSESAKMYYQKFILEPDVSEAHSSGDIHIHDLDFYTLTTTCCQMDLDKLFKDGFSTGHGYLREPNDIMSYSALACIAIQANQNDQHGGQSLPAFDFFLSKGVKKSYRKYYINNIYKVSEVKKEARKTLEELKDLYKEIEEKYNLTPTLDASEKFDEIEKKVVGVVYGDSFVEIKKFATEFAHKETDRATYQGMEALVHNLNTMHSRAGAQVPFSSLNYGTDISAEGRMVVRNLLLSTEAGLGNGETPIFPIQIFKVKDGVNANEGEPNYDLFELACRVSAKRLFPNFSFLDTPYNIRYYREGRPETEVVYMGCRTRVIANVFDPSREMVYGRGNLSFTSINLPRLAILSEGNLDVFYKMLKEKLDLVSRQLLHRFRIQASKTKKNFPFLMGQGNWLDSEKLGPNDTVGEILKHGTLSIGFIGLSETLTSLVGKHHGEDENAQKLGLEIIKFMKDFVDKKSQEEKMNFTLLATPAEGLAGRFVELDKKKFGIIKGVTDKEYYTNSFHIPVDYQISAFRKIEIEAPYHALTNAGHITYVELDGDTANNIPAFIKIIKYMKKCNIGYGSINHPVDRDPVCGYNGIIGDACPKCGRKESEDIPFQRIRRITGYLVGTIDRFNNAKRAEERARVKHDARC